jgi:hypothetical protein
VDSLNLEALGFQILPDELTKLHVVIDNQDALGGEIVRGIGLGWPHYTTLYLAPAGIGSLRDEGPAAHPIELAIVAPHE